MGATKPPWLGRPHELTVLGEIRAHSVGLRGDRAAFVEGRARILLVENRESESACFEHLEKSGAISSRGFFFRVPRSRWMRDSGPLHAKRSGRKLPTPLRI